MFLVINLVYVSATISHSSILLYLRPEEGQCIIRQEYRLLIKACQKLALQKHELYLHFHVYTHFTHWPHITCRRNV